MVSSVQQSHWGFVRSMVRRSPKGVGDEGDYCGVGDAFVIHENALDQRGRGSDSLSVDDTSEDGPVLERA